MGAKPTFGTTLKTGADKASATEVEKTVTITPPKKTRGTQDATTHASPGGAMEFIGDGVYDSGELSFQINYVAGDADDTLLSAAFAASDPQYFEFTANSESGTETFECMGVMTEYGPDELPVQGKQTATGKVKITGPVTQAATA